MFKSLHSQAIISIFEVSESKTSPLFILQFSKTILYSEKEIKTQ